MELSGITRTVASLEKSREFYEGVLGFERAEFYEPTRWQAYRVQEGVFLAIGEPPGSTDEIALGVADLDGLWEKVKDTAEVVHPLETTPWGTRRFVLRDPDGHLIAFSQKDTVEAHALLRSLRSQYRAAMEMLKSAIERCPPELWNAPQDQNKFWQIAYHVLFFVHLYQHEKLETFRPWVKHRNEYEQMGPPPWDPDHNPEIGEPYSREEVLEFWDVCANYMEETILNANLGARSGFDWLPFSKFELYLYNLRHLEQHTGELMERLGSRAAISVDWRAHRP